MEPKHPLAQNGAPQDSEVNTLEKLLIPVNGNEIAPRFDLAVEVLILTWGLFPEPEEKTIVLPQASAEKLCHLILTEGITCLICGAIEEEYHQFLLWKKIDIIDNVAGPWKNALARHRKGALAPGDILFKRSVEGGHVYHP